MQVLVHVHEYVYYGAFEPFPFSIKIPFYSQSPPPPSHFPCFVHIFLLTMNTVLFSCLKKSSDFLGLFCENRTFFSALLLLSQSFKVSGLLPIGFSSSPPLPPLPGSLRLPYAATEGGKGRKEEVAGRSPPLSPAAVATEGGRGENSTLAAGRPLPLARFPPPPSPDARERKEKLASAVGGKIGDR